MVTTNVGNGAVAVDSKAVIVTCDAHIGPRVREDLAEYCPKKYRNDFDEFVMWMDSQHGIGGIDALESTKGHYDVHARLRDLDADGMAAEVIFHGSQNGQPIPWNVSDPSRGPATIVREYAVDMELAAVGRQMYTRWLADFCSVEPERHVGLAQLPMWDIDRAIEEMSWAREHGLRGVNFPSESGPGEGSTSRLGGRYYYHDPKWEPFWSACEDLGMNLGSHGGFGPMTDPTLPASGALWVFETLPYGRKPIPRMIFSGVFERHPNLKVVYTEHMGNWWTPLMEDMDSLHYMTGLPKPPSEYAKQSIYIGASFQSRKEALDSIEHDYWKNIIWGNDYPHVEGTWNPGDSSGPNRESLQSLRYTYHDLDPAVVKGILGDNACRVWGLDYDKLFDVAQKIDAPTLGEVLTPIEAIPEQHSMWSFRQLGAFG